MNREIKFRGKSNKDGKWLYGNLCENTNGEVCIQEIVKKVVDGFAVPSRLHPVNPDTIGQYTGLKTKDGKEIWEGDIVSIITDSAAFLYKIVFSDGCFCVADKDNDVWDDMIGKEIEVIGNTVENKDLLKD